MRKDAVLGAVDTNFQENFSMRHLALPRKPDYILKWFDMEYFQLFLLAQIRVPTVRPVQESEYRDSCINGEYCFL